MLLDRKGIAATSGGWKCPMCKDQNMNGILSGGSEYAVNPVVVLEFHNTILSYPVIFGFINWCTKLSFIARESGSNCVLLILLPECKGGETMRKERTGNMYPNKEKKPQWFFFYYIYKPNRVLFCANASTASGIRLYARPMPLTHKNAEYQPLVHHILSCAEVC